MKALLAWIDDRTGLCSAVSHYFHSPVPGRPCSCKSLPSAILFCFLLQGITGMAIWMYFSAGAQSAWESVYYLQHEVPSGWLLRAVHHYSAQVMLVLIGLYLLQIIVTGAYRAPREVIFWLVLLMGLWCLGSLLTGDLLAWDLNSRDSTNVRVGFLNMLPAVGPTLYKLFAGGPEFGHGTLTRFLALHVAVFSGGFLVLWILHNILLRRARESECGKEAAEGAAAKPFWPEQAAVNAVVWLGVLIIVFALALSHGVTPPHRGVELGAPADPGLTYPAARPEWAFRGLYGLSHAFSGSLAFVPIFVLPTVALVVFIAMPWIARREWGYWFNIFFTLFVLVQLTLLTAESYNDDRQNEDHQAEVEAGRRNADRVVELAHGLGIPPGGAMMLLREDPKTQGPVLFKDNCLSCHAGNDADGIAMRPEDPSAPDLRGFANRAWIAGILDPEKIKTDAYFGKTKFRSGDMVDFVLDTFEELEDDEKAEVETIVMTLSAEAQLPAQRELDAKDADRIKEGAELMADWGCIDCHKFHNKGQFGGAPDLTGYGSREWLTGIISDPAHKRFYGKTNDRMPAYAGTLSTKQIEILSDYLRGDWFEPEVAEEAE